MGAYESRSFPFRLFVCLNCLPGLNQLKKNLVPEINEYYLFHGTKQSFVDLISDGFDARQTSDKLLFGRGVYFAECTTKSDQHTG